MSIADGDGQINAKCPKTGHFRHFRPSSRPFGERLIQLSLDRDGPRLNPNESVI